MTAGVRSGVHQTQEAMVARLATFTPVTDMFGTRHATLIGYLDYDHAQPLIGRAADRAQWDRVVLDPVDEARGYLDFAIGKVIHHRGMSALRSIDHYREWAWLSGDEYFQACLEEPFPNYGAPILQAICRVLGAEDIWNEHLIPELQRMADGHPCTPGCTGCTPYSPTPEGT